MLWISSSPFFQPGCPRDPGSEREVPCFRNCFGVHVSCRRPRCPLRHGIKWSPVRFSTCSVSLKNSSLPTASTFGSSGFTNGFSSLPTAFPQRRGPSRVAMARETGAVWIALRISGLPYNEDVEFFGFISLLIWIGSWTVSSHPEQKSIPRRGAENAESFNL